MIDPELKNIIEAFKLIGEIEESKPIEYRLYYDKNTGSPIKYSAMDEEGDYIVITFKDYELANFQVKVIDGKLIKPVHPRFMIIKRSDNGFAVHPENWNILVDSSQEHIFVNTVKVEDLQNDQTTY